MDFSQYCTTVFVHFQFIYRIAENFQGRKVLWLFIKFALQKFVAMAFIGSNK